MILIGLGNCGIQIAAKFTESPAYSVVLVNSEKKPLPTSKNVPEQYFVPERRNPEDYESLSDLSQLSSFAENNKDPETCLILASCGNISGLALRILEIFKDRQISVLLIRPDLNTVKGLKKTQDRAITSILQEYARSGVFKELFIVQNDCVEKLFGQLPVYSYFTKINSAIFQAFHMLQILRHNNIVLSSSQDIPEIARICTLGLCDLQNSTEQKFADLENANIKEILFLVPKKQLEEDSGLLTIIRNFVNINIESDGVDSGFKIYESSGDTVYVMSVLYSSKIQTV